MGEIEIIMPHGALGASDDDSAMETAMRAIGVGFGQEDEWSSKYGTDFENDTFLMKRYCWCDRQGECPWCTGCGIYADSCAACTTKRIAHSANCYSEELAQRLERAGVASFDLIRRDEQSAIKRTLCRERGLPFTEYLFRCDCGTDVKREAARATSGCDYHRGTGIFDRFAPWGPVPERGYYDPPNFWFKPTNFRMTWYKYIGRDMATNSSNCPPDLLDRVFATHPKGMTAKASLAELRRAD